MPNLKIPDVDPIVLIEMPDPEPCIKKCFATHALGTAVLFSGPGNGGIRKKVARETGIFHYSYIGTK
jgi:hypothetical protein